MSEPLREDEILYRAVAGDRTALDGLITEHCARLRAHIAKRLPTDLRGTLQVEDVIQEVLLEVSQTIKTFRGPDQKSFYAWLCAIAAHRLIDLVRAARAAKRGGGRVALNDRSASVAWLLEQVAVSTKTPSWNAARHECALAVRSALERIPEDYRTALRLRYLEGLAPAEVAARMGRKEEAVRLLCHRGLKHLADALGPKSRFLTQKG